MAEALIVAPQVQETEALLDGFRRRGHLAQRAQIGRMTCAALPSLEMIVATGGHGKTQFAVQTQHFIDQRPAARLLLCVGAAGRLGDALSLGDVVVGTSTIEHDYKVRFVQRPVPCHQPDAACTRRCQPAVTPSCPMPNTSPRTTIQRA